MSKERYDLIVLGSGSAARVAAERARDHGARVVLVESRLWGGSCPNVACRPTKAYLVAAEQLHDLRVHARERGIDVPDPTIDLARTRAWKDSVRRDQASWMQLLASSYDIVEGEATFVDRNTVRVDERELEGERVLIATGSRTAGPPIPGIEGVPWIDHVSALELDRRPDSVLVVGAGPVGLEFAQIFQRFGSRVTVVNRPPRIAERADEEAAAELQVSLEDEGIEFLLGVELDSVSAADDGIEAEVAGETMRVSHLLLASGRSPNVETLRLDRVGVEHTSGGIVVDDRQRTSVSGIWAAGDVALGPMFTPTAQYQGRIAVDDMFGDGYRRANYAVLATAIFTDPELGTVGLTEREAKEQGFDVDVVKHPLQNVTRAQFTRTKHGLYKIVFARDSRMVVGVHVVSRGASDIVGSLAPALHLGLTIDDLAAVHHIYPSYSEGLKAAAEQAPVRI